MSGKETIAQTFKNTIIMPALIIFSAAMTAHAYDTTWISPQQTLSSAKLKANLDEIQSRLTALESERVFRATISQQGVLMAQNSAWTQTNRLGTGSYLFTFTAGTFSAPPTCVATAYAGNAIPPAIECFNVSTTGITCQANAGGSNVDTSLFLICAGPR